MSKGIFITGGASGLGRAIAEKYAAEGWRVCIGDLNEQRGAETVAAIESQGGNCEFVMCDVTKQADLQRVADQLAMEWPSVDVVVNNAGVAQAGDIDTVSLKDWQWIIDINLLGVVRGAKAFTPLFKKQSSGYFVNTASMAGLLNPPGMSAYNVTKAAVVSLSETMDVELEPYGIGVSVVCPSFFRTNLNESMRSTMPGMEKALDKLFEKSPINAEDIANDIFNAVKSKQFYVLPHKDGRQIWTIKRLVPRHIYGGMVRKRAAAMNKKMLSRKAAS